MGDERVALVLPVLSQAQSLPVLCGTVEREGAALPELSQLSLLSPVLPLTAQPASQGGGVHGLREWQVQGRHGTDVGQQLRGVPDSWSRDSPWSNCRLGVLCRLHHVQAMG